MRYSLVLGLGLAALATANARVFDAEKQYETLYGPNVNKAAPLPPPHKIAIYRHKPYVIVALFDGQSSQGEFIVRSVGRFSDTEVNTILSLNQGSSSWKKEKIETKDPKLPQVSLWSRKDGKLFALYGTSGQTLFLMIGTKRGGDFLIKQKDQLAAAVKI